MRATTEREASLQEKVMSRIGLDSIRRLPHFLREICWQRFCSGFLAANRAAGAKRKVGTVVRSCRYDLASDQPGALTGTMSGTQVWSDHGQAGPNHDFSD
jgi:hypothetical protein